MFVHDDHRNAYRLGHGDRSDGVPRSRPPIRFKQDAALLAWWESGWDDRERELKQLEEMRDEHGE